LFNSGKITTRFDSLLPAVAKTLWFGGAHAPAPYTGVSRFLPVRRRFRKMAFPLLLEFRFRNPCCRLRRIFEG
jgi:hypothetical protein